MLCAADLQFSFMDHLEHLILYAWRNYWSLLDLKPEYILCSVMCSECLRHLWSLPVLFVMSQADNSTQNSLGGAETVSQVGIGSLRWTTKC